MATNTDLRAPAAPADAFDPDELFALARLEMEKGNIADALWKLKRITSEEGTPIGAFSVSGQLYAQLGLWERALRMFRKHLETQPEALGETFSVGLAYSNTGRVPEAIRTWDGLLQKHPAYVPALFYRGLIHAQQGRLAPAKHDLETLVKSAAADNPYLKPAKELLQNIEMQQRSADPAAAARSPSAETLAALARNPYRTEPGA